MINYERIEEIRQYYLENQNEFMSKSYNFNYEGEMNMIRSYERNSGFVEMTATINGTKITYFESTGTSPELEEELDRTGGGFVLPITGAIFIRGGVEDFHYFRRIAHEFGHAISPTIRKSDSGSFTATYSEVMKEEIFADNVCIDVMRMSKEDVIASMNIHINGRNIKDSAYHWPRIENYLRIHKRMSDHEELVRGVRSMLYR